MNEETVVWGIHAEAGEGLHPWFDFLNKCEPVSTVRSSDAKPADSP
jgi:hypothetical protein